MGTSGPGDVETRWLFRPLPDQRVQHPLGALSLALPLGVPLSWDSGFLQRGWGTAGVWKVLLICGTFSTTPGAPGRSRLETQTHSGFLEVTQHRTLRPERNRVGISFLFPFLFTNLGFILECNWFTMFCLFLNVQQGDTFLYLQRAVLLWILFPLRLLANVV